jgi:hypothetical protein
VKNSVYLTLAITSLTPAFGQDFLEPAGQDSADDLAQKLANPLASLISVPIQSNYDEGFGPSGEGSVWRTNIQPVVPFSLNDDWNLISRTIIPVVEQTGFPAGFNESGLGDTVQSFFFSPKEPINDWIVGIGPVFLLPTATDGALGGEQWGVGPTFVALKQSGPWTVGLLANHISSFAGESSRSDVNATFLQPFVSYITPKKTTIGLSLESTFDWTTDQWAIPINLSVNQLVEIGDQPVQFGAGVRYWAESPDNGPEQWGFRLTLTFLFPQ